MEKMEKKSAPKAKRLGNGWHQAFSEKHQRHYYFNSVTNQRTWHEPEIIKAPSKKVTSEWSKHWDERYRRHFYFNKRTGESTWTDPSINIQNEKLRSELFEEATSTTSSTSSPTPTALNTNEKHSETPAEKASSNPPLPPHGDSRGPFSISHDEESESEAGFSRSERRRQQQDHAPIPSEVGEMNLFHDGDSDAETFMSSPLNSPKSVLTLSSIPALSVISPRSQSTSDFNPEFEAGHSKTFQDQDMMIAVKNAVKGPTSRIFRAKSEDSGYDAIESEQEEEIEVNQSSSKDEASPSNKGVGKLSSDIEDELDENVDEEAVEDENCEEERLTSRPVFTRKTGTSSRQECGDLEDQASEADAEDLQEQHGVEKEEVHDQGNVIDTENACEEEENLHGEIEASDEEAYMSAETRRSPPANEFHRSHSVESRFSNQSRSSSIESRDRGQWPPRKQTDYFSVDGESLAPDRKMTDFYSVDGESCYGDRRLTVDFHSVDGCESVSTHRSHFNDEDDPSTALSLPVIRESARSSTDSERDLKETHQDKILTELGDENSDDEHPSKRTETQVNADEVDDDEEEEEFSSDSEDEEPSSDSEDEEPSSDSEEEESSSDIEEGEPSSDRGQPKGIEKNTRSKRFDSHSSDLSEVDHNEIQAVETDTDDEDEEESDGKRKNARGSNKLRQSEDYSGQSEVRFGNIDTTVSSQFQYDIDELSKPKRKVIVESIEEDVEKMNQSDEMDDVVIENDDIEDSEVVFTEKRMQNTVQSPRRRKSERNDAVEFGESDDEDSFDESNEDQDEVDEEDEMLGWRSKEHETSSIQDEEGDEEFEVEEEDLLSKDNGLFSERYSDIGETDEENSLMTKHRFRGNKESENSSGEDSEFMQSKKTAALDPIEKESVIDSEQSDSDEMEFENTATRAALKITKLQNAESSMSKQLDEKSHDERVFYSGDNLETFKPWMKSSANEDSSEEEIPVVKQRRRGSTVSSQEEDAHEVDSFEDEEGSAEEDNKEAIQSDTDEEDSGGRPLSERLDSTSVRRHGRLATTKSHVSLGSSDCEGDQSEENEEEYGDHEGNQSEEDEDVDEDRKEAARGLQEEGNERNPTSRSHRNHKNDFGASKGKKLDSSGQQGENSEGSCRLHEDKDETEGHFASRVASTATSVSSELEDSLNEDDNSEDGSVEDHETGENDEMERRERISLSQSLSDEDDMQEREEVNEEEAEVTVNVTPRKFRFSSAMSSVIDDEEGATQILRPVESENDLTLDYLKMGEEHFQGSNIPDGEEMGENLQNAEISHQDLRLGSAVSCTVNEGEFGLDQRSDNSQEDPGNDKKEDSVLPSQSNSMRSLKAPLDHYEEYASEVSKSAEEEDDQFEQEKESQVGENSSLDEGSDRKFSKGTRMKEMDSMVLSEDDDTEGFVHVTKPENELTVSPVSSLEDSMKKHISEISESGNDSSDESGNDSNDKSGADGYLCAEEQQRTAFDSEDAGQDDMNSTSSKQRNFPFSASIASNLKDDCIGNSLEESDIESDAEHLARSCEVDGGVKESLLDESASQTSDGGSSLPSRSQSTYEISDSDSVGRKSDGFQSKNRKMGSSIRERISQLQTSSNRSLTRGRRESLEKLGSSRSLNGTTTGDWKGSDRNAKPAATAKEVSSFEKRSTEKKVEHSETRRESVRAVFETEETVQVTRARNGSLRSTVEKFSRSLRGKALIHAESGWSSGEEGDVGKTNIQGNSPGFKRTVAGTNGDLNLSALSDNDIESQQRMQIPIFRYDFKTGGFTVSFSKGEEEASYSNFYESKSGSEVLEKILAEPIEPEVLSCKGQKFKFEEAEKVRDIDNIGAYLDLLEMEVVGKLTASQEP